MTTDQWNRMLADNGWNEVELRDSRYNQVVHMVSIADASTGRRRHFSSHEGMDLGTARQLDLAISQAWVGHPYYDVINNSTDFDRKLVRMIAPESLCWSGSKFQTVAPATENARRPSVAVCDRLDIEYGDRLSSDSYKRKFLVAKLPDVSVFPKFQDFTVVHDYLMTPTQKMQARIDRRGQNDNWTYTHTIRCPLIHRESPEMKMQVTARKYELLLAQKDSGHYTVYTTRRCFLWNNQYYQLDVFEEPCPPRCKALILLETYTSNRADDFEVPPFLDVESEVTGDSYYSMYNLSKKLDPELPMPSTPLNDSAVPAEIDSESELCTGGDDSTKNLTPTTSKAETNVEQPAASETITKLTNGLPNGVRNGYHLSTPRKDQVATDLDLDKLDISAVINDALSENGHAFFGDVADYERFAKWCHSSKFRGAALE